MTKYTKIPLIPAKRFERNVRAGIQSEMLARLGIGKKDWIPNQVWDERYVLWGFE